MISTVCIGTLFFTEKDVDFRWSVFWVYAVASLLLLGMAWVFADRKQK
jgi:hypothetical protein